MPKVGQGEYLLNSYLGSCFTNCFSFTSGKATASDFPQIFQKLPREKSGFLLNLWICVCCPTSRCSSTAGESILCWKYRGKGRVDGDTGGQSLLFGESEHNTMSCFHASMEKQKRCWVRPSSQAIKSVPVLPAAFTVVTPCVVGMDQHRPQEKGLLANHAVPWSCDDTTILIFRDPHHRSWKTT